MPSWEVVSFTLTAGGNGDLITPLRQAVRREGRPTVRAAKAAWLTVDVTSTRGGVAHPDRSTGLRARVAAATFLSVTASGIRVAVRESAVDPRYGRSLAWYLNASGRRPWRHPIFGRRGTSRDWTTQRGQEVFFSTITERAPTFRAGIARAMEEVARKY